MPRDPRRRRSRPRRRVRRRRLERDRARSPASSTPTRELVGVEAGGLGLESGQHGASVSRGVPGVLHGARSLFLQDEDGQILEAHSISAGLDYPGVGPEHAQLAAAGPGRVRLRHRRRGARRVPAARRSPRASCPRSSPRTRSAGSPARPGARCRRARPCSSRSRAGATRTRRRSPSASPASRCDVNARSAPAGPARRRAQAARPVRHRRARRRLARRRARRRRRRRRRGRDRHPVLRSGDGRPHDPGGVAARARPRRDARRASSPTPRTLDVDVPLVVMTYYNPVQPHGPRALRGRARATPASTARSSPTSRSTSSTAGPTPPTPPASRPCSSPRRPRPTTGCVAICERSRGFVYGVSLMGVTGERAALGDARRGEMGGGCKAVTDKPVLLGVGISNPEQAVEAAQSATA